MQSSQLNTISVPATTVIAAAGSQTTPPALFTAADVPIRVEIRNAGPNTLFLAHDQASLSTAQVVSNTFLLKTDKEVILVLAPGQSVYAAGLGAGGLACIAASEALPVGGS